MARQHTPTSGTTRQAPENVAQETQKQYVICDVDGKNHYTDDPGAHPALADVDDTYITWGRYIFASWTKFDHSKGDIDARIHVHARCRGGAGDEHDGAPQANSPTHYR